MGTARAILRGKFIAIQDYLRKQEKPQINNLTLQLKGQEKEDQRKLKVSRRKEILKIRPKINKIKTKQNRATLVVQWLRIHLPMQGTQV